MGHGGWVDPSHGRHSTQPAGYQHVAQRVRRPPGVKTFLRSVWLGLIQIKPKAGRRLLLGDGHVQITASIGQKIQRTRQQHRRHLDAYQKRVAVSISFNSTPQTILSRQSKSKQNFVMKIKMAESRVSVETCRNITSGRVATRKNSPSSSSSAAAAEAEAAAEVAAPAADDFQGAHTRIKGKPDSGIPSRSERRGGKKRRSRRRKNGPGR